MYRFTSEAAFDKLFESGLESIADFLTTQEFYPILIPIVARIGCGHTSLWTPDGYWDRAPEKMFPLGVYARDGRLHVIHSYNQESPIEFGSRVIAVNGLEVDEFLGEMLGNIWSDGLIMTKRYHRLNNVFPYLFALMYGYPDQFDLTVAGDEGETKINLEPIPRSLIEDYHDSLVLSGIIRLKDLELDLLDDNTALLSIRTFGWYDNVKGFRRFIDSSFQVIRENDIKNIVIDLRGNDGGDPWCSSHLLTYLQRESLVYFSRPYGKYAPLNQPLPIAEHPFTGEQYYLIDGMCFSTTGHITSLLKYHQLGTFVGEETGATFTCNDASHDILLKNSGYRVQSARRSFATAVSGFPMDRGIMPDYVVRPTIEDVIQNHDAVLEYTIDLVKK